MGSTVSDWMIYTFLTIFGLMIIDFLIAFSKSFWAGSFNTSFLGYLRDIVYYVFPLNIIISLIPLDPTGWILVILFFVGGISVIIKYVMDIKNKFRK